jgi:hypothetical protein
MRGKPPSMISSSCRVARLKSLSTLAVCRDDKFVPNSKRYLGDTWHVYAVSLKPCFDVRRRPRLVDPQLHFVGSPCRKLGTSDAQGTLTRWQACILLRRVQCLSIVGRFFSTLTSHVVLKSEISKRFAKAPLPRYNKPWITCAMNRHIGIL